MIYPEKGRIATCKYCGLTQTLPKRDSDDKLLMFDKANTLRRACEFDLADEMYDAIISDFPEEAEAYWGLVLCRYGIEYVNDPVKHIQIPTCHRASGESLFDDEDFQEACDRTDSITRKEYQREAKIIDDLRTEILSVSAREDPYDVFICYKETDELGHRTQDSLEAYHAYEALTKKGYKVFYSKVSLESHLGESYEPYIYNALNTSRILLLFGRPE